jgi:HPt (histidine-containing phosphotransfer) domain-containing protein
MTDQYHQSDQPGQLRHYRHIDPAVLLTVIDGELASFCVLSRTFLADAPVVFVLLERAWQDRASAAIAHHSHALKNMCALLGARQLSSQLQAIESAALVGESDLAGAGIDLAAPFAAVPDEVRVSIADREGGGWARVKPDVVPG